MTHDRAEIFQTCASVEDTTYGLHHLLCFRWQLSSQDLSTQHILLTVLEQKRLLDQPNAHTNIDRSHITVSQRQMSGIFSFVMFLQLLF